MFRLKRIDTNNTIFIKSNELDKVKDNEEYDLEILQYPRESKMKKGKQSLKRKTEGGSLQRATEKCLNILKSKYFDYCKDSFKNNSLYQSCNMYCPFHEHPKSSKTPSARFYVSNNNFVCFSNNCDIKTLNSINFLNLLETNAKKRKLME